MIRRDRLESLSPQSDTHAGLWLDRYLVDPDREGAKQEHIDRTLETVHLPAGYTRFFERWKAALESLPNTFLARAQATGRLIVGLGAESVLEASITLHRTYGVPYLPGSALKGLAAAAAHRWIADPEWKKALPGNPIGESHRVLFGDTKSSGYVTFHDALWIPDGASRLPLDPDVLTVHHPGYYGGENVPPTDWDSPLPVPFASAHGTYLLAFTGPPAWTEAAYRILKDALVKDGLGAKTAAGYGRFKVDPEPEKAEISEGPKKKENLSPSPPLRRFEVGTKRISAEVVEVGESNQYILRAEGSTDTFPCLGRGVRWAAGDKIKVKVTQVDKDGRILKAGV